MAFFPLIIRSIEIVLNYWQIISYLSSRVFFTWMSNSNTPNIPKILFRQDWYITIQMTSMVTWSHVQVNRWIYDMEEMLTSQKKNKKKVYSIQSHTTALKKSKLYNNEQVGKTTIIKKNKFYHDNRFSSSRAL